MHCHWTQPIQPAAVRRRSSEAAIQLHAEPPRHGGTQGSQPPAARARRERAMRSIKINHHAHPARSRRRPGRDGWLRRTPVVLRVHVVEQWVRGERTLAPCAPPACGSEPSCGSPVAAAMWRVMLALALALQQLGLCAPAAPEWNLEGLDEAAEPAAVTLTEVRAACQTETATCEKDDECATALAESFAPGSVPHPHPPQKLIDVLKCFKSGNSLESAKRIKAAAEKADNIKAITDDIACQFCGHLVEDMWSMVVQNVYQHQVQSSVEQEARMWLEDLCHLGKQKTLSTLEKFIGLYDISPSEEDRPDGNGKQYRIDRDVPWADDPAGAYSPTFGYVGEYEDAVVTKSTLEERQWSEPPPPPHHTAARQSSCVRTRGEGVLSLPCLRSVAGVCTAVC